MRKIRDYEHHYENEGVAGSCQIRIYENGERPVVIATQQTEPRGAHKGSVLNAANIIAANLIREGVLQRYHLGQELRAESVRRQTLDLIADAAPFVFVEEYLEPERKLNFLWFDSYEEIGLLLNGKTQEQIGNPYRQPTTAKEVEDLIGAGGFACECDERFWSACEGLPFYGEHEGWRYCVLHFPGFTEKIYPFDETINKKLAEEDYNFRGAWFPYSSSAFQEHDFRAPADFSFAVMNEEPEEDVPYVSYFSGATFKGQTSFKGMRFCTPVSFEGTVFEGGADFSESVFEGSADFTGEVRFEKVGDFSGVRFADEAKFDQIRFAGGVELSGARFEGDAIFYDAEFGTGGEDATLDFTGAEFHQEADFGGARFRANRVLFSGGGRLGDSKTLFLGGVDFGDAEFGGQVADVTFEGHAVFAHLEFPQGANFSTASFDGEAHFWGAVFNGEAGFYGASFSGPAYFNEEARFRSETNFMDAKFAGYAGFVQAEFAGSADFDGATFGGASFRHASFERAGLSRVTFGSADFTAATFAKGADFRRSVWNEADFAEARFFEDADFTDATFENLALFKETAFMARARFFGTETNRVFASDTVVDFQDVRVQDPAQLIFHTVLLRPSWLVNADARNFTFTNTQWYGLPGGPEGKLGEEIQALQHRNVESSYSMLAKTCRDLYANYEEKRDYPLAGEFHYWSMDVLRREGWGRFGLIRTLYWGLSGYGERPRRAFWWLVTVFGAFSVLYMLLGPVPLRILPYSDLWHLAREAGKAAVYSLGAMARLRPEPMPEPGVFQFLVTLEGILGPLQAALLALAIRRKVMR